MSPEKKNYLLFYLVVTTVFSVLICMFVKPKGVDFGFGARLLALLLATPAGFIGALTGDFVRRFAIPDAVFTDGSMLSLIKTKLFWLCVPQLIGMFAGIIVGTAMVLH
jgi:hypothetical protein